MAQPTAEHLETLIAHVGRDDAQAPKTISTPIYQTATYPLADPGSHGKAGDYYYSRFGNPTVAALERAAAALEGGDRCLAFGSGIAAVAGAMALLNSGDHMVSTTDIYGGTGRLQRDYLSRRGITVDLVDKHDLAAVEEAMRPNTRLVWVDTLGTPLLFVTDIERIAEIAHRHSAWLGVDNTISTPYFQNPLTQGADLVVHSCTKYLGGHHDLFAGLLIMGEELYQPLLDARTMTGAVLGPFDAWLVLRSIKTLAVRMEGIQSRALQVARFLEAHPRVGRVLYPGLQSHPQHRLAREQMRGFGGLLTFGIRGAQADAERLISKFNVITSAVSFGGVESLSEIPPQPSAAQREVAGLASDLFLVRLSVGLEHVDDLISDLEQALAAL